MPKSGWCRLWTVGTMNCWMEAVATELQLQYFMLLLLRSDPDGGAESGEVSVLSIGALRLLTFRRQVLGHDRFQMKRLT